MVLLMSVAVCSAEFKLGAHGAYTLGGDVEDETFGPGAQVTFSGENVSLELSGTWFENEFELGGDTFDIDTFSLAATLRLGGMVSEGVNAYAGGGVNYNIFEIDEFGDDPDDEAGFHACAGVEIDMGENLELFAEYRHSWVEYTVEIDDDDDIDIEDLDADLDYEFGMARVGLNIVL